MRLRQGRQGSGNRAQGSGERAGCARYEIRRRRLSLYPAPYPLYTLLLLHVLLEPRQCPFEHIAAVSRIDEAMTFVGIDDQLRRHMLVAQRMPELEGLGRRAFAVAIADHNQRRRLDALDETDGGA